MSAVIRSARRAKRMGLFVASLRRTALSSWTPPVSAPKSVWSVRCLSIAPSHWSSVMSLADAWGMGDFTNPPSIVGVGRAGWSVLKRRRNSPRPALASAGQTIFGHRAQENDEDHPAWSRLSHDGA